MKEKRYASGLTEGQVAAAVDWWAMSLKRPKFDNGDDSQQGAVTMMFAMMGNKPVGAEKLKQFRISLRKRLEANEAAARTGIHVDYHPDQILRDSAIEAGINPSITSFSWKTMMWFKSGGVQVSAGYGAPIQTIYDPTVLEAWIDDE